MKKLLLVLSMLLVLHSAFSQTTYFGTLEATDPTFHRPDAGTPPISLSTLGTNTHYDVIIFTVAVPGLITVTSSSGFDNFGFLYGPGGFNPTSPLSNVLVGVDDFAGTDFGFTYNFTVTGTYYIVVTSLKNAVEGPYFVTLTPATPVPLKLVSFSAERKGSDNIMRWTTTNELDVDGYQLQRSNDGVHFTDVANAVVKAQNTSATTNYSLTDKYDFTGRIFYRLAITEKTAAKSYSFVVPLNSKPKLLSSVGLYPNPAIDKVTLELQQPVSGKINLSVINAAGAVVYSKEQVMSNETLIPVDVKKLSAGRYVIKTSINNENVVVPFIKN